jgi:hypothetical protein
MGIPKRIITATLLSSCLVSFSQAGLSKPRLPLKPTLPRDVDKILEKLDFHHVYDDEDNDAKPLSHVFYPALRAILTTIYGTVLILFAPHARCQIHCMTMFRVTGQKKLEQAIRTWRHNFLQAKFAIVRRAPSFLLAGRSILQVKHRIQHHRHLVQVAKKAKGDGTVTQREAKRLSRMHKREIRNLKRDMQRLIKASTSVGDVLRALDFDDVLDVVRSFLFQFLAVLATNHEKKGLGSVISNWCLFLNVGGLMSETHKNLGSPIATLIQHVFAKQEPNPGLVRSTGNVAVLGTAAYLVLSEKQAAGRLNMALLSSAVVMRGLKRFVKVMLSWDDDDDDGIWPGLGRFLEGGTGGALSIVLTAASMFAIRKVERNEFTPPDWLLRPLHAAEKGIQQLAVAADRIV